MTAALCHPHGRRAPMPSRRSLLAAAGLALLAPPVLSACGATASAATSGGSSSTSPLDLQLNWIKTVAFAGEYFADEQGYYDDEGLQVDLRAGGAAGTSAESVLMSGQALVGLSSPVITAAAIAEQQVPLKIIGAKLQRNPYCLVSLQEQTPLATIADLAGRRIGVQSGSNETVFNGFCKANSIDPSTFTVLPVQYDPAVLVNGEVDAYMSFSTNEPITLAAQGLTPIVLAFADNGLPLVETTFTTRQETIKEQRDLLKSFLRAEVRGWTDAVADPDRSAQLAVDVYGKDGGLDLQQQVAEATAQNQLVVSDDTRTHGLFTMTEQLVAENIASLAALGTSVSAEQLFDLSLLQEVYAEDPTLISG